MRTPLVGVVALSLLAGVASAQTGSQPMLVISMYGGMASGNSLWNIPKQPFCVLSGQSCSGLDDTLRLTRDLTTGLMAGVVATYFRNRYVGITGEVFYMGLPLDDGCTGLYYNADPFQRNEQMCNAISGSSPSTSALGVFAGLVLRAGPRALFSPYVRGGVGLLSYSTGTVEMSGVFADTAVESRAVIIDPHEKKSAFSAQIAAGFTTRLGPGYQFRMEVRDLLVPLERVTGVAPQNTLQPPTATRVYHRVAFTIGLDVVLEQKRGRRY